MKAQYAESLYFMDATLTDATIARDQRDQTLEQHPDQRRDRDREDDAANALATLLPESDRIVLIEDTAELRITHPNLVRFEARRAQADAQAGTIRDLLRATLRHRPDRILVGEVRGGEAFDLLQTLNTGHSGSLSTIHANSAEQALARFASCVLQSGVELPYQAIRRLISESVDLVVHLECRRGLRSVTEVVSVTGYEPNGDMYELEVPARQRQSGSGTTTP